MSLSSDLSQIRKLENLSIEFIHQFTKMPVSVIESIENGSIFEDESKNLTYKRSFIRTYSKALKISDIDIVSALDLYFNDNYNGELLDIYGQSLAAQQKAIKKEGRKKVSFDEEQDFTESNSSATSEMEEVVNKEDSPKEEIKKTSTKAEPIIIKKPVPEKIKAAKQENKTENKTQLAHTYTKPYDATTPPPTIQSVNWVGISERTISFRNTPKIIAGIIVVGVLAFGVYWFILNDFSFFKKIDQTNLAGTEQAKKRADANAQQVIPIDTLKEISVPPTPEPVLDDTLSLLIFAVTDKLEPVRVKTDLSNSYFPYWIEKGQAMRFEFKDSISIRGQYNRMELIFNNREIKELKESRGANREILLKRDLFESHPDWLKPDTVLSTTNRVFPDTVINRPVFN